MVVPQLSLVAFLLTDMVNLSVSFHGVRGINLGIYVITASYTAMTSHRVFVLAGPDEQVGGEVSSLLVAVDAK